MRKGPLALVLLGVMLLVGALLWRVVAVPALVRYPLDLHAQAVAKGTFTLYLDPAKATPLPEPTKLPLTIHRSLKVDGKASSGSRAVVRETDAQDIGGMKSQFVQQYVIDRRTLRDVDDPRAFAYDPKNRVDRSPAYAINLDFGVDEGTYSVWKNEVDRPYRFRVTGSDQVHGVTVERLHGTLRGAALSATYVDELGAIGLPKSLTLDQARPQLEAAGIRVEELATTVLPKLSPEDTDAVLAFTRKNVPLRYTLDVDTRFGVEKKTGAIVDLQRIDQTVKAQPDPEAFAPLLEVLDRYDDPAVRDVAAKLHKLTEAKPFDVFNLDYAQTDASIADTTELAKDLGNDMTLAERTVPLAMGAAGLVLLALGLLLNRRRRA